MPIQEAIAALEGKQKLSESEAAAAMRDTREIESVHRRRGSECGFDGIGRFLAGCEDPAHRAA